MEAIILNRALELTLEWGETLGKPIHDRLMAEFTHLSRSEADACDHLCREAGSFAFREVERAYVNEISGRQASANILDRYPWIDSDRLARLWSQGQYYAWKDNG